MITNENGAQTVNGKLVRPTKLWGLSTDEKPTTNIANGSTFIEMDAGKLYFYDAANGTWREWGA